jgi:hypothetical protein
MFMSAHVNQVTATLQMTGKNMDVTCVNPLHKICCIQKTDHMMGTQVFAISRHICNYIELQFTYFFLTTLYTLKSALSANKIACPSEKFLS